MDDSLGGLLTPDLIDQFRRFQSVLQPSEQDREAARKQAALLAGLAALGARKGNLAQDLSRAAMGGVMDYNNQLAAIPQQRMQNFAAAAKVAQFAQQQQQQQAQTRMQERLGNVFAGQPQLSAMQPGGPTPVNTAAVTPSPVEQYRQAAALYAQMGNTEGAKRMADIAASLEAEYSTTPQTLKDESGALRSVLVGKRGETKTLPYLPAEKLHFADTGGQAAVGMNPYTGQVESRGLPKTMTPGEVASNSIAQQRLALDREQAATGGQIVETPQGYARIGKDNAVTPIVAGGAQLQPKPTGTVVQQIATNNVTLGKIDRAAELVDKNPSAFGLKNYMGDPVMQRVDPKGVEARAMIADIAGQKIHDRSGAAVTVGEAQRLKPYVPNVSDEAPVVRKKLELFRREYAAMQRELAGGKLLADVAGGEAGGGWTITERK